MSAWSLNEARPAILLLSFRLMTATNGGRWRSVGQSAKSPTVQQVVRLLNPTLFRPNMRFLSLAGLSRRCDSQPKGSMRTAPFGISSILLRLNRENRQLRLTTRPGPTKTGSCCTFRGLPCMLAKAALELASIRRFSPGWNILKHTKSRHPTVIMVPSLPIAMRLIHIKLPYLLWLSKQINA